MGVAGEALVRMAVEDHVGHRLPDPGDQLVAQGAQPGGLLLALLHRGPHGRREPGDRRGVEGARAHVALLTPAVEDGNRVDAARQQQRSHAHRAADLVPGQGERLDARLRERDGQLPHGLHRVGVERDAVLPGDRRQLGDALDGADLVVGPHDADHGDAPRIALDRRAQGAGMNAAVLVDGQELDRRALPVAQPVGRIEGGVVLDGADQHPVGPGGLVACPEEPLDGEVVGLRAPGGEDDLARPCPECAGDGLARLLDDPASAAAGRVEGGGVADAHELCGHRLDRFGEHRRSRRVV